MNIFTQLEQARESQEANREESIRLSSIQGYDPRFLPKSQDLEGYEQNPYKAMLLLLESSGYGRDEVYIPSLLEEPRLGSQEEWTDETVPESCHDIWELLKSYVVTDDVKDKAMKRYLNRMNWTNSITYCACCGIYEICNTDYIPIFWHKITDDICQLLQMNENEDTDMSYRSYLQKFHGLRHLYPDMFSIVISQSSNILYHLIPEYVTLDSNGDQILRFCSNCNDYLQKKKLPKFCLRNGYDFGSASRAGLPKLSDLAICLLNPVALYGHVVKQVAPQGYNSNAQHSALIGHIIAFENKLTTNDECKELPRIKIPPSLFSITLIGAKRDALEKIGFCAIITKYSVFVYLTYTYGVNTFPGFN